MKPLSIYIHYPFCKSKCPYCDFNSHVSNKIDHEAFIQAYLQEIDFFAEKIKNRRINTIFFGGGTPSLMPIQMTERILAKISQKFLIDKNCEISMEANPTSFEAEKFLDLRKIGINRLSIGIQALNDADLKFLGRQHSSQEAINTIKKAQNIFENFSFDLIYARPNQSIKSWLDELNLALTFGSKHLSLYQLTIEKGTQFFTDFHKKKFEMPDEELSAKLYEETNELMEKNNFINYEISNYAKKDFECKHNLSYWLGLDYIGFGAGAHSRIYFDNEKNRRAIMNIHDPKNWLNSIKEKKNAIQKNEEIFEDDLIKELILMGLRLENGIDDKIFLQHFNKKLSEIIDYRSLKNLENQGLLEVGIDYLKITKKGKILTNAIIEKLLFDQ